MRRYFVLFMLFFFAAELSFSQEVEHNYLVGPQNTSCDSLKLGDLSVTQAAKLIRKSKFRFDQNFRLTRKQGLQSGEYFSCDGKTGFLIIKYNAVEFLFSEVKKETWNQIISSSDPEGFFLDQRSSWPQWKD